MPLGKPWKILSPKTPKGKVSKNQSKFESFVDPPFQQVAEKTNRLKSDIKKEKDTFAKHLNIEHLSSELNVLVEQINTCLSLAKDTVSATKTCLENISDPSSEWEKVNQTMLEYQNSIDEVDKKVDIVECEFDNIRGKYKKLTKTKSKQKSNNDLKANNSEFDRFETARLNINSFIDPPFQELKSRYFILKSKVEQEKNASNKYVDMEEMIPDLIILIQEATGCFEETEKRRGDIKSVIESSPDPSFEWPKAIVFKNSIEEGNKCIERIEIRFEAIKKKYKTSPEAVLARKTKDTGHEIGFVDNLQKFKLPIELVNQNEQKMIRRYDLGNEDLTKPHKTLMMVGMTGSGKSLMINNIINYVYGVNYEDNFRFELIVDKEEIAERGKNASKSKANSMTSWVTGFNLYYQEGFRVNFGLTIIDTPGFGDTRGIKYDEVIVNQIREFFLSKDACPSQEIDCVGFVIQASTARITEDQKYVFDQVLNVFGKNLRENIFLMFTFSDAQPAPALEVVKTHKIPFADECVFKFNNSALFAPNTNQNSEFSWHFGYNSLAEYFSHVGRKTATSLTQTVAVLEEREYLKILLEGLQPRIDQGMNILQSIEAMIQSILELRGTARANKHFKVKTKKYPQSTKIVNHSITNCKSCMQTCHSPCYIFGDRKRGCASMLKGKCGKCPGNCPWEMHANGDRIYIYTEVESEETIQDMCEKYNIAVNDKHAKKKLLLKLFEEYQSFKVEIFDNICKASTAAKRLEEIALRNTFLTNVVYINRLIKSEEVSNRPNKKVRLEQLYDVLRKATILEDAKQDPNRLSGHANDYEETILRKINDIEDELEYDWKAYFYGQNENKHYRS